MGTAEQVDAATDVYFNVDDYCTNLYAAANPTGGPMAVGVTVTERTLGDNMDYGTWKANKFDWKSVDDATFANKTSLLKDDCISLMNLGPQRIRLFRCDFATMNDHG